MKLDRNTWITALGYSSGYVLGSIIFLIALGIGIPILFGILYGGDVISITTISTTIIYLVIAMLGIAIAKYMATKTNERFPSTRQGPPSSSDNQ
ncbi:MAG TPA: hypothetical protein VKA91_06595 [Nitrososphaeraceae archaeon]|nr:hypothetical protein [Nitrososphaeraceae archaeon]